MKSQRMKKRIVKKKKRNYQECFSWFAVSKSALHGHIKSYKYNKESMEALGFKGLHGDVDDDEEQLLSEYLFALG